MKPAELARLTVEKYLAENKLVESTAKLTGVDIDKAGTFVSIKTVNDDLRGCIGTILPTRQNVIEEIIHNAVAASVRDPRFQPIEQYELENLKFSVDILHPPEPVNSLVELDPEVYGVIVTSKDRRQGLLLPNLDGVDTVEHQIQICRMKARISPNEQVYLSRFKVDRYYE